MRPREGVARGGARRLGGGVPAGEKQGGAPAGEKQGGALAGAPPGRRGGVPVRAEEVMGRLRAQGVRLTPQRRRLVEVLAAVGRPATAGEVRALLREGVPGAGVDTVYRNLRLLVRAGLVNEIRGASARPSRFELAGAAHHHHLVCVSCGLVVCLARCPAEEVAVEARAHSFSVTSHSFELYGQCASCRGRAAAGDGRVAGDRQGAGRSAAPPAGGGDRAV